MGKRKDEVWKHAKDSNGLSLCKYCEHKVSGATRLKYHLSGNTGSDIVICPKVPEDVKLAYQAFRAPEKKLGKLRSLNNDGETQVISPSAPNKKAKSLHQPAIVGECKKDKSVVDEILAKYIISNNITPDFAKMPYLVDLLRSVAEFGTSYEIPNTSALTSRLIPGIHEEVEEHVGNVKKLFTVTGCTLVMYEVEVDSEIVCINALASTPAGVIYVGKIPVQSEEMAFSYLIDEICSIIDSLGPENVVQCIFNISEIIDDLTECEGVDIFSAVQVKYPRILLLQNGYVNILERIYYLLTCNHSTIYLAVVIFSYLHKHYFNLLPQRDHTSNIKEYGASWWVTMIAVDLFVLRTILEIEKELQALQLPIATESCEGPSREKNVAEIVEEAIHSTEFWTRCKKVVQVLLPLFRFLEIIDCKGSTFGYLYEASKRTEEAIKQLCDGDAQFHRIIKWFEDWKSQAVKPVHAAAAFLNPACVCSENFTKDTDEMQASLHHLTVLVPPEERDALSEQLKLYSERTQESFFITAMKKLNTIHPRKWWESFGDPWPILQKLAVRILSQPCSVPLLPQSVNFQHDDHDEDEDEDDEVRMNLILMENFGTVKSQNSEPIHLTSEDPDYAYEDVLKFLDEKHFWMKNINILTLADVIPSHWAQFNKDSAH